MTMIYDCFTFFNEIDILKIRFEELYPVVDKFVVVEGTQTFQGEQKPALGFQSEEFEQYEDKISWCLVNEWPEVREAGREAWEREYHQRNAIASFLEKLGAQDDDIILISDADEIPRRSVVESLDPDPVQSVALDVFYYGLNVWADQTHTIRAVRYSELKKSTPQLVRTLDSNALPSIEHGGWHFSYLGTPEHVATKFRSFAHTELNRWDTTNPGVLSERMSALQDLWGDGHVYERKEIDESWPVAIVKDRGGWSKYVY